MYPLQYLGGKGRLCKRHFSFKLNAVDDLVVFTNICSQTIRMDSLVTALNKAWQAPWQAYIHHAWRPSNQQPNNHVTMQHLRQPQVFTMEYEAAIKESWLHFWRWRARLCTEVSDICLTKPGLVGLLVVVGWFMDDAWWDGSGSKGRYRMQRCPTLWWWVGSWRTNYKEWLNGSVQLWCFYDTVDGSEILLTSWGW